MEMASEGFFAEFGECEESAKNLIYEELTYYNNGRITNSGAQGCHSGFDRQPSCHMATQLQLRSRNSQRHGKIRRMGYTVLSVAYPLTEVGQDAVGGSEQVLTFLDRALTEAGHQSLVIAAEGSSVKGKLIPS